MINQSSASFCAPQFSPLYILLSLSNAFTLFRILILCGMSIMVCVTLLKYLTMDCEPGCWFLLFGIIKQVSENLGFFLLFSLGLKLLNSDWFSRGFARIMCDLRGKSGKLKYGVCSKIVLNENGGPLFQCLKQEPLIDKFENVLEKFNPCTDSHEKITTDCDKEYEDEENDEFDVSVLRNLVKLQRRRTNAALAELEKERAASATAAEEAMAMIMRLQNEKSLVEMESSQYRRLAEEKQIHDQKVIESLQWLVWRHESERGLLEDQLKSCKRAMKRLSKIDESEEAEEAGSSFHGNILEDLENVLYSSREANFVN